MLLLACVATFMLRLAAPDMGLGQMSKTMGGADMTATHMHGMTERVVTLSSSDAPEQRCKSMLSGCATTLGMCPFASVFVMFTGIALISPAQLQFSLAQLAADDLSPLGSVPRIPPRP